MHSLMSGFSTHLQLVIYRSSTLAQCYWKNGLEKKTAYEERVREIQHGSLSPLFFSATGGMGLIATVVYKRDCPLSCYLSKFLPSQCYRKNGLEKKMAYEERVREIQHGPFSPLFFSAAGGMGLIATVVYKRDCPLSCLRNKGEHTARPCTG